MIHISLENFNGLLTTSETISSDLAKAYSDYIMNLDPCKLECNKCHSKGNCVKYGHYERSHLMHPADMPANSRISIQRIKCKRCNTTHALLPEEIIPYLQFAVSFIYLVLLRYFAHTETVDYICQSTGITPTQLYRWKARFEKQKDQYLGVVESAKHSDSETMDWLCRLKDYPETLRTGICG